MNHNKNNFPEWHCDQEWKVKKENAELIFKESEKYFDDQLDGYKGIVKRYEFLLGVFLTITLSLIGFYINKYTQNKLTKTDITSMLILAAFYIPAFAGLIKNILGKEIYVKGFQPKTLMHNKKEIEQIKYNNFLINISMSIQIKINEINQIKNILAKELKFILFLLITPWAMIALITILSFTSSQPLP